MRRINYVTLIFGFYITIRTILPSNSITLAPIYWNASNPIFKLSKHDHVIHVNLYDEIDFICPHYENNKDHQHHQNQELSEYYIIYQVSRSEYDACVLGFDPSPMTLLVCNHPGRRKRYTLLFQSFHSIPNAPVFRAGGTYYYISVSTGYKDGLNNLYHGACYHGNMKLSIHVCCRTTLISVDLTTLSAVAKKETTAHKIWSFNAHFDEPLYRKISLTTDKKTSKHPNNVLLSGNLGDSHSESNNNNFDNINHPREHERQQDQTDTKYSLISKNIHKYNSSWLRRTYIQTNNSTSYCVCVSEMKRKGESIEETNGRSKYVKKRQVSESESIRSATSVESSDDSDADNDSEEEREDSRFKPEDVLDSQQKKKELYKPPTTDELNELRETETLFQSGLMRLQISELLTEVRLSEKRRMIIESFVSRLSLALMEKSKDKSEIKLSDLKSLKKNFKFPIHVGKKGVKGVFKFISPQAVHTIGSFSLQTSCKSSELAVDVAVVIPKECLQAKDHLNQRYFRKRALYLGYLANHLKEHHDELVSSVTFSYHQGNHMKPILIVKPTVKCGRGFVVKIHVTVEKEFFRLNRFHLNKSNVRSSWFYGTEQSDVDEESDESSVQLPTPHYNSWMLSDILMLEHHQYILSCLSADGNSDSVRDAIILLKIWAHQRQLDVGIGSFNGHVATAFIIYLIGQRKVSATMSSYQIFRSALVQLASMDWTKQGISLSKPSQTNVGSNPPALSEFHSVFPVVFVDKTGFMNLCADMSRFTYTLLKHEAGLSLEHMDGSGTDPFHILFMTKLSFIQQFDLVFHTTDSQFLEHLAEKTDNKMAIMDLCGNKTAACLPAVLEVLMKALNERIKLITVMPVTYPEWSVTEEPPTTPSCLTFGILLDSTNANTFVDKGPPADKPEAVEFREFWGEKSEIRRFQDGVVCEAVVWPSDCLSDRRMVVPRIIKHILNRHCYIDSKSISIVCNQLDSLLRVPLIKSQLDGKNSSGGCGTGEEGLGNVVSSCDKLGKILRSLSSLPLNISLVQGLSASARYAEVFPPAPIPDNRKQNEKKKKSDSKTVDSLPVYVQSVDVVGILEGSGKWPEDRDAVQRVKAALYLQLANELRDTHRLEVAAYTDHVMVFWDGFVFRLILGYMREIQLCKTQMLPNGMLSVTDTPESLELERKLVVLPKLNSVLHGVYQQHNSYSVVVRLAKRWLSSQLMLQPYISEEIVEIIVAHLYISSAPYEPPRIPIAGFLRFLQLLSSHGWQNVPLIINLNNEFTKADLVEIQTNFTKNRAKLPLMFVATPGDPASQRWTKTAPTALVLNRVARLAKESLRVLEDQLLNQHSLCSKSEYKVIFRPSLEVFDAVIHLIGRSCSRQHQAIDAAQGGSSDNAFKLKYNGSGERKIPVVDFDPVQFFLRELRETFGELALFFHDSYGGCCIGVVWKPPALESRKFKVFHAAYSMPEADTFGQDVQFVPNIQAVLEDIKLLGRGVVDRIELKKTN